MLKVNNNDTRTTSINPLFWFLFFFNIFHTLFKYFFGWLRASIYLLGNNFFTKIILRMFGIVAIWYLKYAICETLVLPMLG